MQIYLIGGWFIEVFGDKATTPGDSLASFPGLPRILFFNLHSV